MQRVKFKGADCLLVDGALTTEEAYRDGRLSFAHVFKSGEVLRFGKAVGTTEDIEYGEFVEDVEVTPEGFENFWDLLCALWLTG